MICISSTLKLKRLLKTDSNWLYYNCILEELGVVFNVLYPMISISSVSIYIIFPNSSFGLDAVVPDTLVLSVACVTVLTASTG